LPVLRRLRLHCPCIAIGGAQPVPAAGAGSVAGQAGSSLLISRGHAVSGLLVILLAKLLGTAVAARLFALTRNQLMRVGWFARAYQLFMRLKAMCMDALLPRAPGRLHNACWPCCASACGGRRYGRAWGGACPASGSICANSRHRSLSASAKIGVGWQSDCHASMTAPIHFAGISMIIVMTRYAQDEQIQAVVDKIRAAGLSEHVSRY
jgi:hypothetical protein